MSRNAAQPTWGDPPPRRFERLRMVAFVAGWVAVLYLLAIIGAR